jgi:SAM-dependent methyltransferase
MKMQAKKNNMAHAQQRKFCRSVLRQFPWHFKRACVVDVGSLDINGTNRDWMRFFRPKLYTGVDIVKGKNVNWVGRAHEVLPSLAAVIKAQEGLDIDTIVSTEMLEHDRFWKESLRAMYNALRPGGLLLITAGGTNRMEHGTHKSNPACSPGTLDYYENISSEAFMKVLPPHLFSERVYHIEQNPKNNDFQFYAIKRAYRAREIYRGLQELYYPLLPSEAEMWKEVIAIVKSGEHEKLKRFAICYDKYAKNT